ncbi:uncharacterized protein LOC126982964 [Eriocheir sinensis]|uniref:uncharacterized protein LOC126982964 n=1 Tax=Eriocheir sinensis TaxID=95602 RepID=UPI0021C9DA4F|nr:uncharacterized protein LOC126982964 [Eriocheir sinensis]XP_050691279.1 uncharacterized protein LOC126982964 [Eriocheir sinensis]
MRSRSSMEVVMMVMVMVMVVVMVDRVDGGRREKRFLFINPDAPITLGFILNMPISLALPTLAPKSGRALQEVGLRGAAGGWGDSEAESTRRRLHPRPEELAWDPAYEQPLSRLTAYFTHLELPTLPCQERLLCELSAEPEAFDPIDQIFMKELRMLHGPVETSEDSLIWRYMKASREGFGAPLRECAVIYSTCPLPAERILNMPVLKVWQYIASKLNLQLV